MTATRDGGAVPVTSPPSVPDLAVTGVRSAPTTAQRPGTIAWPLVEAQSPPAVAVRGSVVAHPAPTAAPRPPARRGLPLITEFDGESFLRPERVPPEPGWRRAVWWLTRGGINPTPSPLEARRRELVQRIQARTPSCQRIAVASGKGGVGKTTATILCGTALAMHRLDRIIAIDANPDVGSLGWRVERETEATLSDLIRHAGRIERYSDVRALTSQSPSRLEVLASELDPAVSQALSEEDFARAIDVLERYYSVVLSDLGTGLLDGVTQAAMRMADELVIVASPSIDAGRVANFTLDFIERRYPAKARNAVVLLNNVRKDGLVDVDAVEEHFARRVRAVIRVPYDRHLATGGPPTWGLLSKATRAAYIEAAAALAEGFASASRR